MADAMAIAAEVATTATSVQTSTFAIIADFLRSGGIEKLTSNAIKNLEIKVKGHSQATRTTVLRNLKTSFKEENLVLVLGAGISLDYSIPTWSELLKRLLARALDDKNENQKMVSVLFNEVFGPNALIAARYLKLHFDGINTPWKKKFSMFCMNIIRRKKAVH